MQPRKPKIGLLLLTAEWFSEIGATGGSFAGLPKALEKDAARIETALSQELEVINPGVLATTQQVEEAVDRFRSEMVDAVVCNYITWGEDRTILRAVELLGQIPLLLWAYSPFERLPDPLSMPEMFRASGPVGALQASGPLKRLGKRFATAYGPYEDSQTLRKIVAFSKAAMVASNLKSATIGVLPYRCDQMSGTFVDEFRLKADIGPSLKYISLTDYRQVCDAVSSERLQAFVHQLQKAHLSAPNLTPRGLELGARVSLGLADLVAQLDLDAVAIEDVCEETHRILGLRPCLSVPELFDRAVVSMEAEIGGAVGLMILKSLTDLPVMYTEVFTIDPAENTLLIGHAGIEDARLAERPEDILIEPDGEYVESEPDSAWMSFRAKGGHVTLLSVFCDVERFKLVITEGEALPGPRRLLGSPHAVVRLETPLESFFEQALITGMTQHWALVHADVIPELIALGDILQLDTVIIE